MRIDRIHAKHFRTLSDIELRFSPEFCTISGRNNAGKSCIIRLLITLFERELYRPWIREDYSLDYKEDVTQWADNGPSISVDYRIILNSLDDPALIKFIEKQASKSLPGKTAVLEIGLELPKDGPLVTKVSIEGTSTDEQTSNEIIRRLKDSKTLFLHNSTTQHEEIFLARGRGRAFYEIQLSSQERESIREAERTVERKVKKLARAHRDELSGMLGKLIDKYDVEFTTLEGGARQMPLGINLRDKTVEVPLNDWGSGTQNRTRVLMSILQANRIKTQQKPEDKITPIVVIEEPESFLHPSAQAEFGRLLQELSSELGIQIIVSTHSPYMLNQAEPSANILLSRRKVRTKLRGTVLAETGGEKWMAPFADHLGIIPPEFEAWRELFGTQTSRALLVEGDIDKSYLEHIRKRFPKVLCLPEDVEIVPYGGKDALKNTMLVKFVLGKFDKVFITFDLDCDSEISKYLLRLGLKGKTDFLPMGVAKPGKDCIEGILPESIIKAVMTDHSDLVMQLGSSDSKSRREAKRSLKAKYLEEFKRSTSYDDKDLSQFETLGAALQKAFRK